MIGRAAPPTPCHQQVDALSRLERLRRLDVSCNRLSSLSALSSLAALECLAAERNRLTSRAGLEGAGALVELYAARNALGSFRAESRRLGKLPRLAVVDLTGNPLVQEEEVGGAMVGWVGTRVWI